MKTLYESILDSDKDITSHTEEETLAIDIVKQLRHFFNEYLERESDVKRVGTWYPLGNVDDDLYNRESIKDTERFIITTIKNFHKELRKTYKHLSIDVDVKRERTGEIRLIRYIVKIDEYMFDFVIRATVTLSGEEVDHVKIWTYSEKIFDINETL